VQTQPGRCMTRHRSSTERQSRGWRAETRHKHWVDCYWTTDGLEVVYCTTCGEEW